MQFHEIFKLWFFKRVAMIMGSIKFDHFWKNAEIASLKLLGGLKIWQGQVCIVKGRINTRNQLKKHISYASFFQFKWRKALLNFHKTNLRVLPELPENWVHFEPTLFSYVYSHSTTAVVVNSSNDILYIFNHTRLISEEKFQYIYIKSKNFSKIKIFCY